MTHSSQTTSRNTSSSNNDDCFLDEFSGQSPMGFGMPKANFDPENVSEEAQQAHQFRERAFGCATVLLASVAVIWIALICNTPEGDMVEAFYLWGAKTGMATVVLLCLSVGVLNFAIKCYGHHNAKDAVQPPSSDSAIQIVGKVFEAIGKAMSGNP